MLMAEDFRLLGDPTRLAILRSLSEREKSISQLVGETGLGQANVSKHLKLLTRAGLAGRRKVGLQVFYRVGTPLVEVLCQVCGKLVIEGLKAGLECQSELLGRWGDGLVNRRPERVPLRSRGTPRRGKP